jgi:hypothetical protein
MSETVNLREAAVGYREALNVMSRAVEMRARQEAVRHGAVLACTRGCAWCCHQKILASAAEGAFIYVTLQLDGQWTRELAAKLQDADAVLTCKTHNTVLAERIPCAFLTPGDAPGRGLCFVYPIRPLGCRSWYSAVSDPTKCADPDGSGFAVLLNGGAMDNLVPYILGFEEALGTDGAVFTLPGAVLYAAAKISGKPDPGVHCVRRASEADDAETYADMFDKAAKERKS